MSEFWWGILVVVALWIFFSARSKEKGFRSFAARDAAEPWFQVHGINSHSVRFSAYEDISLARNSGATVIVGTGQDARGEPTGFVLEVLPGRGVVEGQLLMPPANATWHKTASMEAKMAGMTLIDVLVAKANHAEQQHAVRTKNPETRNQLGHSKPNSTSFATCPRCGGPGKDGVCWSRECGARW